MTTQGCGSAQPSAPVTDRTAAGRGTHAAAVFAVVLDRRGQASLAQQLAAHLRGAIDDGQLVPGALLPATRTLAAQLGVARGTVVAAFEQLASEGYLESRPGAGTRVNPALPAAPNAAPLSPVGGDGTDPLARLDERPVRPLPLTPGVALADLTDRTAWRRAWHAARSSGPAVAPAAGLASLRNELAAHLARSRHSGRQPADFLVTAGAREGLALVLTALFTAAGTAPVIGVEDPGYPSLRRVAARLGARLVALPVDAHGLVCDDLPRGLLDAVLVTPSHQYPAGGTLPLDRRMQLVRWANRNGVVLLEDDFDAALRYRGEPLPLLSELDDPETGSVITLGSFAASLPPAVALGYLLAPRRLHRPLLATRSDLGSPVAAAQQIVVSELLRSGELSRRVSQQRQRLTARHRLLTATLDGLPGVRVAARTGGINAIVEIRSALTAEAHTRLLRQRGLGPVAESQYWRVGQRAPGYAAAGQPAAPRAAAGHAAADPQSLALPPGGQRFILGLGGDEPGFRDAIRRLATVLTGSAEADAVSP